MIQDAFTFENSPWELKMEALHQGDSLSATEFLTLLEGESEEIVEDALLELEQKHITLTVTDLPKPESFGEAAQRLHFEQKLVQKGLCIENLEDTDPLRLYLEELAGIPVCGDPVLLSQECARRNSVGDPDPGAAEMLVNLSLHRVIEIAREFVGCGVLLMDLIQEGGLGLWQSVLSFVGGDFEKHSEWYIRQGMAKLVVLQARSNGVGLKMRQALEDYRGVDEKLLGELGRNPTLDEIAEQMHISVPEAEAVARALESARMMHRVKVPEEDDREDETEADQAVENTAYFQSRQRIAELLSGLDEKDVRLLTLRFGLEDGIPMGPVEVGKQLGMTGDEVTAREAVILQSLRTQN